MLDADRKHVADIPLVIVVDDDAAVRASLKFALESEGFAVRAYHSGCELLKDASLADCACFIIDHRLPAMNGLQVVAALREKHIAAPAVLITSNPPINVLERAAWDRVPIVEKPLLGNALIDCVRDLIARSPASP